LPDGKKFVGHFENGRATGYGTMYDKNGKILAQGYWRNYKYIGKEKPKDLE